MRQVVHRAMLPAVITLGACAREHPSPTDAFATADSAVLRAPPSLHVLALSTYDGSGQTVHPDYVAPQRPWATPSHFLAITPYPGGDSRRENPSLFTGSDGVNWTSASGSPNPLVLPSAGYLSDPDILYSPSDNQLFLYYRQSADEDLIFLIRSSDGHQWGPATQVVSGPALSILSPSVVRRSSSDWLMWTINPDSGCRGPAAHAELRRSVDGVAWTDPQVVDLNGPGGLFAWHVDVQWIHSRNEYWALFPAKTPGNCSTRELFFATSPDGLTWQTFPTPVLSAGVIPEFSDIVYRSTFSYDSGSDDITFWFSGASMVANGMFVWNTAVQRRSRADVFSSTRAPVARRMSPARPGVITNFSPP